MEEFTELIKNLMHSSNLWKEGYIIEFNKKKTGQSLTFFIKDNENKIYIAKFFNYMQGISDDLLQCLEIEAETIEEFEDKLSENSTILDVEQVIECIYLSKRSFKRYIEVCQNTKDLFPKVNAFKENVKVDKKFYGLLIEDFVIGTSLVDIINNINCKEEAYNFATNFLLDISDTIKKYTEYGFVHRDISPDNIIITENKPIIIDPGFIKIVDRNSTKLGLMLGKVYYASPEQFKGNAAGADFTSDLYSIAIIIFEMVTGKNLIYRYLEIEKNTNPHLEIIKNIDRNIEDEFFSFTDDENDVKILLFNILKKMLQVDRQFRFNDIESFIDAVSLLKGGEK